MDQNFLFPASFAVFDALESGESRAVPKSSPRAKELALGSVATKARRGAGVVIMAISSALLRFARYYRCHGLLATNKRILLAARRTLFSNRAVLFYCDLSRLGPASAFPEPLQLVQKKGFSELSADELQRLVGVGVPTLICRRMEERFNGGASLWLIKFDGQLAGYGWTLRGRVIAPYYLPLAEDDVQFFDFHVFPKFRGRAIDWFLMTHVLYTMAAEGAARAFAESGEWNQASLASIAATPFRCLGSARKLTILGHTIVSWAQDNARRTAEEPTRLKGPMIAPRRKASGLSRSAP